MTDCTHRYTIDGEERACPRPTADDHERCPFHLTPHERDAAGISSAGLRAAFRADLDANDPARRQYVDLRFRELDLSSLVVDGRDVGSVTFRQVTVEGTLDLSGSVVRHPLRIVDCRIGRLDATQSSFGMAVDVDETVLGTGDGKSAFRARRASFEQSLRVADTQIEGTVEAPSCEVEGWFDLDSVTVDGRAHFPEATFGRAQFVGSTFEAGAEFVGATAAHATLDDIRVGSGHALDLSEGSFERLRVYPGTDLDCRLVDATVGAGSLDQPEAAVAHYDLTEATVGDVALDCEPETFDRYRFYRTRFDGFQFASYRAVLRASDWRLHEFAGDPARTDDIEGLEYTYLAARQGAAAAGDSETASMFLVRELRYRRHRYVAHARAAAYSPGHRVDAAVRWLTNGFLDFVAGYGERPQRPLVLALLVMVSSALVYPAVGGLATGDGVVTYASHGAGAVLDGLYFSIVTFATLGLGDVHPAGIFGRFVAAFEGLAGAFLTAVFVFSLGRRVTR